MIRKVTGYANYCIRNSTPLDLAKKALCWQKKMKELGATTLTSTSFDNSEESLSNMNQGSFFLKNLPKTTIIESVMENPISKAPVPTK
ncbi:hypothetical protein [Rickettsiella endosymbiont of Rhagonycha lignosa]|uniref:hypothetical protein n=1 Tax=Rickettsiella endosymbiont of Rhagonycha lignosa TaxID=3077937 RepID=UPI00313D7A7B